MSSGCFLSLASMVLFLPQTDTLERKAVRRPEAPLMIFVYAEPHGDPEVEKKILRAAEEFRKSIDRKKEWFLTTGERDSAEVVVEVQALLATDDTRERTQTLTQGGRTHTTSYLYSQDRYFLFAKATLFGNVAELSGSKGLKNESDAASALAKDLERYVKKNYWQLAERRELFHNASDVPVEELGLEWIRQEIARRVEAAGSEVQLAEWKGPTLTLVVGGDEFRFPFPASGFEPCSINMDCQRKIVDQVMSLLEEPLRKKKAR